MSNYEVPQPILNSPFDEPQQHWHIVEGETPEQRPGRRPAMYYYRDPKSKPSAARKLAGTTSAPFEAGTHGQVAVKVIDDRGNELPVVKSLKEAQ